MGCFCSSQSRAGELGSQSISVSSINGEAHGATAAYDQNIGDCNIENIEYADAGHCDDWNDRHDGGWNENKDIEINADWGGGGGNSHEYDNGQDV